MNELQRYRRGHNEAVLKTVCPQGHMGSNPILCVKSRSIGCGFLYNMMFPEPEHVDSAEVPKWPKGLAWKVSRSLIAARGFKSRLLRQTPMEYFRRFFHLIRKSRPIR